MSFVYLIVNGGAIQERSATAAAAVDQAQRDYIRSVAGSTTSVADEIGKFAALRDQGEISAAEFEAAKSQFVAA